MDIYTSDDSADEGGEVLRKRDLRGALKELAKWDGPLPLGAKDCNRAARRAAGSAVLAAAGVIHSTGGDDDAEGDDGSDSDSDDEPVRARGHLSCRC